MRAMLLDVALFVFALFVVVPMFVLVSGAIHVLGLLRFERVMNWIEKAHRSATK